MIGKTILHYRITEKLGEGGMGVVYKARDTKLKREVAIKFLPRQIAASEEERERFKIEAQAAAALNHPNIATIYAIEEHDEELFIVMEYIEGKELRDIITPLNPPLKGGKITGLDIDQIINYATQIAAGLQAAHEKGIVHRDIKSSNIMITDKGQVKIMDFGLAKIGGGAHLTRSGMTLGTAAYMSPEQMRGMETDHRADIWAFGVVLYEMLTGELPFKGDYEQALMYSIVNEDPKPILELRNDIPSNLAQIVAKALQKEVDARYEKTEELVADLKADETTPASKSAPADKRTIPSIAVLPFVNMSADPENEFFCDGLTEDITAGLSRFSYLSVLSVSAAAEYKSESMDVRKVGKELGARFIIHGGVRKAAKNVRVNVQLLDAETGSHLWAERFDRDLSAGDIFAAQDELTDRIVATVADTYGVLTRSLATLVKGKSIDELTADECVLLFFAFWQQFDPHELAELVTALEQILKREPNHANAWGCLAFLYDIGYKFGYNPDPDALDRALKAGRRAIALDTTNQLGYLALTHTHFTRRELSAFRAAADHLLTLNPRDTVAVGVAGLLLACSGEWEKGVTVIRKAMALNPHHAGWLHMAVAWDYYRKREYEEAVQEAEKRIMPGFYKPHCVLAAANAQLGRTEAAGKHLQNLLALVPDFGKKARADLSKEFVSEDFIEHFLEGLQKAGLDIGGGLGVTNSVAKQKLRVKPDKPTKRTRGKK